MRILRVVPVEKLDVVCSPIKLVINYADVMFAMANAFGEPRVTSL